MFEVGAGICLCQASLWFLPVDGSTVSVNLVALRQISYPQLAMRSNGLKTGNLTSLSRPNYMHCRRENWARDEWRKYGLDFSHGRKKKSKDSKSTEINTKQKNA